MKFCLIPRQLPGTVVARVVVAVVAVVVVVAAVVVEDVVGVVVGAIIIAVVVVVAEIEFKSCLGMTFPATFIAFINLHPGPLLTADSNCATVMISSCPPQLLPPMKE